MRLSVWCFPLELGCPLSPGCSQRLSEALWGGTGPAPQGNSFKLLFSKRDLSHSPKNSQWMLQNIEESFVEEQSCLLLLCWNFPVGLLAGRPSVSMLIPPFAGN